MKRVSGLVCLTFAVCLSIACAAFAGSPWVSSLLHDHPLVGKIYDTRAGNFISPDAFFDRLAKPRHVLLGEIHDNADHHRLQARVIRELVGRGRTPSVAMEMIRAGQASALARILDAHRSGERQIAAAEIGRALNWDKSGWPPFKLYEPIFAAALASSLPIVPGEPVPAQPKDVENLIQTAELAAAERDALHKELASSHCGVLPENVVPKIAVSQRKRDAELALAMLAHAAKGDASSVLIAGSGHARKDRGVPHYLRHLGQKSVTINFREVADGETDPTDLIEPGEADYVWFTPRTDREDPCIALRKRFGVSEK